MGFKIKEGDIYTDMHLNMDKKSLKKTKEGADKAGSSVGNSMGKNMVGSMGKWVKGGIAGLVAGMVAKLSIEGFQALNAHFKQSVDYLDSIVVKMKSAGATWKQTESLMYAADFGGVEFDDIMDTFNSFSERFTEVKAGGITDPEQLRVLKELGVTNDMSNWEAYETFLKNMNYTYSKNKDIGQVNYATGLLGMKTDERTTDWYINGTKAIERGLNEANKSGIKESDVLKGSKTAREAKFRETQATLKSATNLDFEKGLKLWTTELQVSHKAMDLAVSSATNSLIKFGEVVSETVDNIKNTRIKPASLQERRQIYQQSQKNQFNGNPIVPKEIQKKEILNKNK